MDSRDLRNNLSSIANFSLFLNMKKLGFIPDSENRLLSGLKNQLSLPENQCLLLWPALSPEPVQHCHPLGQSPRRKRCYLRAVFGGFLKLLKIAFLRRKC
jgi:hypothetical protein